MLLTGLPSESVSIICGFSWFSHFLFLLVCSFDQGPNIKNCRSKLRIQLILIAGSQRKAWDDCQGTSSLAGFQFLSPPPCEFVASSPQLPSLSVLMFRIGRHVQDRKVSPKSWDYLRAAFLSWAPHFLLISLVVLPGLQTRIFLHCLAFLAVPNRKAGLTHLVCCCWVF